MSELPHVDALESLDRELAALTAVEPSPVFQARVRTQAALVPIRGGVWWRRPVLQMAAAGAMVSALLIVALTPRSQPLPLRERVPSTAPVAAPNAAEVAVAAAAPAAAAAASAQAVPSSTSSRAAAPVRVSRRVAAPVATVADGESRGFAMLVRRLDDGTLDSGVGAQVAFLAEARGAAAEPIHIQAIEIAAIEIAPIVVAAAGETE
jgi:hypothetical protein